ncbi:carboxypeptidase regulatory-like domain-containing protein [Rhodanobacter sp. Col0626]|uniref:carboxypeptidase regulatory-like domain-containing protein n=1 Tax=Rhodanobacter sp. Col0626 TaxID=3415679 RepID=UPI003CEF3801
MNMNKRELMGKKELCLLIAMSLAGGVVHAQSTTGSIVGQVPAGTGETVTVQSTSGLQREAQVDSRGRYTVNQLPLGTYTVTLKHNGATAQTRSGVNLRVGQATDVSFNPEAASGDMAAKNLAGVNVTANTLPSIDVTSVDSRTVITAEQLRKLPLGFTAEAAALLAPGVVNNTGGFTTATGGSLASFGGAGANENAYYINGFNTTDPLKSEGGITLPYGSIDQEEVYTGGYSAQYGRSDGGVINMVGKRGSNEWHFGGQASWEPAFARAPATALYYENGLPTTPGQVAKYGDLYDARGENSYWVTTYDAYVGGPLIKDKLFFFASAEMAKQQGNSLGAVTSTSPYTDYHYSMPKWYAKVDWNINDSNILELTGASSKRETAADTYRYDYQNYQRGALFGHAANTKTGGDLWTAKYTGYLTDNLTLNAMYGKMHTAAFSEVAGYDPGLVYIENPQLQNPTLNGGDPRLTNQTVTSISDPGRGNRTTNLRVSLEYKLGDHTLTAGIDNLTAAALKQGAVDSGPGYYWSYNQTDHPGNDLNTGLGVGPTANYPNGAQGYYVKRQVDRALNNVRTSEHAQFIEDNWQVTDKLLLSLGLRDDQFTNYNAAALAYIKQNNQWAPRLGFAWDVNGDSSFKVYGNAGRYFLASPLEPALSAGSSELSTTQYFTYSGIDASGVPTGLTAMSGPVSANSNFGQLPDPKTVVAKNLKAMYQDEYMLGFSKTLGHDWLYGAKATRRVLRSSIDDFCDADTLAAIAAQQGVIMGPDNNGCHLINAGTDNTFVVADTNGQLHDVKATRQALGFPKMKRNYYALETFLEHPFDGQWFGNVSYTLSRSYGNTEGMTQSDAKSDGPQESADWDNGPIMVWSNGDQGNDHRHQFKAFGYYQITPEWLVSGKVTLQSGQPKVCLGLFPGNVDPAGYGSSYHYCNNVPVPPGSTGRLPWQRQLDLGVQYAPAFAAHKLALHLDVFNVFNAQGVTNIVPSYYRDSSGSPNPLYGTAQVTQSPRYARLSVTYDY